jgi:hypothetical protein
MLFDTFLEEFPAAKELQTTHDRKTYVVMAGGQLYMMYRPITQGPEDRAQLEGHAAYMMSCPRHELRIGWVTAIDTQNRTIIATFENTSCQTTQDRFIHMVLCEHSIHWFLGQQG